MKIAYVYDAVYPWETGGIQKRVWELARRLAGDHDVHWYGLHYWDGPPTIERKGVTLHGVGEPPELYVDDRRSISEALTFAAQLLQPLRERDFDVIDCQEFPYFSAFPSKLAAAVGDASLCLTWHEVWGEYWYEYLGRKGVFGKAVERTVATLPDAHIAVSNRTQNDLGSFGVTESHHVPNGVDLAQIDDVSPAARTPDILFAGRFIPEKNLPLLVRAIDTLQQSGQEFSCTLIGDGPDRPTIETEIRNRDLDDVVTILNFREEYEDVLALMKSAEVFVLPSRREGFGITALEALACGTPVVTIAHPQNAATELIDPDTGAVTAATPQSVAHGITAACEASPERCVNRASAYDWNKIARRVERTYARVIGRDIEMEVTA